MSKSTIIATSTGECVKVYLDLKNNYVYGLQRGAIPFLRKLGWNIDKRNQKNLNDYKKARIFHHTNKIKINTDV